MLASASSAWPTASSSDLTPADALQRELAREVQAGDPVAREARVAGDERLELAPEEAGVLAGEERPEVAHPVGRVDEVGEVAARRPELRQDRPERREVRRRRARDQPPIGDRRLPRQREVGPGVVVVDRVMHRAHERQVMRLLRQERQVLAEREPGHGRRDRPELAANPLGRVGLHVPEVLVRRPPLQEEEDQRLRLRPRIHPGPEQPRQAEPEQPRPSHAQDVATADAVTQSPTSGRDSQHGPVTSRRVFRPMGWRTTRPTIVSSAAGPGQRGRMPRVRRPDSLYRPVEGGPGSLDLNSLRRAEVRCSRT